MAAETQPKSPQGGPARLNHVFMPGAFQGLLRAFPHVLPYGVKNPGQEHGDGHYRRNGLQYVQHSIYLLAKLAGAAKNDPAR
jgi:hypothetical protein